MGLEEMRALVAQLGDQLRWAAAAATPPVAPSSLVVVAGMGGSGISGDFASVLARLPVHVHKGYGLPGWTEAARPLLAAVSYSGDTEETLSAVAAAIEMGLEWGAVTSGGKLAALASERGQPILDLPGGLPPRAAFGYLLGGLLRLLAAADVVPDPRPGLEEAALVVDALTAAGGPGRGLAADLAEGLNGRVALIYGSVGLVAPAAQRWKTQFNENAKWPAWWSLLPELDHNEIEGFGALPALSGRRVGIVALRDREEPPAVAARFRLTQELTQADVRWVGEAWSQGESELARTVSLAAVGDLVSLELAERAEVDPSTVPSIEQLKRLLAREG